MPLSLESLTNSERPVVADISGSKLNLRYKPMVYTDEFVRRMNDISLGAALAGLLSWWDLTRQVEREVIDEEQLSEESKAAGVEVVKDLRRKKKRVELVEEMYPLVAEEIDKLPLLILNEVVQAITNDLVPNRRTRGSTGSMS